jgi:tRNA pseudouridine55 synthase
LNNDRLGPSGFLIIDKPAGITSFDVIRELRRMLRIKKLGHSGVLDKPAMGVLVIGANRATRLFELFGVFEKEYSADIWLGLSTSTDDLTGELVQVGEAALPEREALEKALALYSGAFLQIPPAFSLTKKGGRELYRYALAGEAVEVEPKSVAMLDYRLVEFETGIDARGVIAEDSKLAPDVDKLPKLARARVELRCSGGFYVRSLARDAGADLGTNGTLGSLTRTRVGPFHLANALTLDAVANAITDGKQAEDLLLPLAAIAPEESRLYVDASQLSMVRNGRSISRFRQHLPAAAQEKGDTVYAIAPGDELVAVLKVRSTNPHGLVELKPSRVLN